MKLLLTDLDGTLTESWNTKFLLNVTDKINELSAGGVKIAVVTNQGGVGYRRHTQDKKYPDLQSVLERMNDIARMLPIDKIYVSLDAGRAEWTNYDDPDSVIVDSNDNAYIQASWRPDWCKPDDGMLMQACNDFDIDPADCLMIGDRDTDKIKGFNFQWAQDFFNGS